MFKNLGPTERKAFLAELNREELEFLWFDWPLWARAKQLPPPGNWRVWLLMAGRGFGKTRTGAEWIRSIGEAGHARHIALVGDTFDDVRHVMIEGGAGILATSPPSRRPHWARSLRQLRWDSGTTARCFSADDPEQLRGPEFDIAWADEIAKWRHPEAWDNLMLALRVGDNPRCLATTTPRPRQWLSSLAAAPDTVLVHGTTQENEGNLSPAFFQAMQMRFGGTSLGRQELDGVLLAESDGALWSRDQIMSCLAPAPRRADLLRVVVGVDPATGGGETGIIVAGKDKAGTIWVLADNSCRGQPDRWAAAVQTAFASWRAEAVIAEVNQGGDLVSVLLQQAGHRIPVRQVRAMRSKPLRAEPVAAAYARGQIRHAAAFGVLEDQMCNCVPGLRQSPSPDRLDAMVWAVNALLSGADSTVQELHF